MNFFGTSINAGYLIVKITPFTLNKSNGPPLLLNNERAITPIWHNTETTDHDIYPGYTEIPERNVSRYYNTFPQALHSRQINNSPTKAAEGCFNEVFIRSTLLFYASFKTVFLKDNLFISLIHFNFSGWWIQLLYKLARFILVCALLAFKY